MPRKAAPKHPFVDKYPAEDWLLERRPKDIQTNMMCCGVKEYHGLQECYDFYTKDYNTNKREQRPFDEVVKAFFGYVRDAGAHRPYWLFTDNDPKKQPGEQLAKYIEKHDLGKVIRTGYHMNYNSAHKVQVYIAILEREAQNHLDNLQQEQAA